jgi:hypothetical protein
MLVATYTANGKPTLNSSRGAIVSVANKETNLFNITVVMRIN